MIRLLSIATVAAALAYNPVMAEETISLDHARLKPLGIETATPEPVDTTWSIAWPAKVVIPNNRIEIVTSLYPGLVKALHVAEGDRVAAGDKLADIASPAFLEAQQDYLDALAALEMERKNFARDKMLLEEGIISEKRFQAARVSLSQAENGYARQKQALLFAGMDAARVAELDRTRRISPTLELRTSLDGTVLEQMVRTGEPVDEATALYSIGRTDVLWLEIHVPVSRMGRVSTGARARLEDTDVEGKVISIGRMIHDEDQGVLVRASVTEKTDRLLPGQFVTVKLEQKFSNGNGYRVPRQAIFRDAEGAYLFRQISGGFALLPVDIIAEEQDAVVIRADIAKGDRVAVSGISVLKGIWQGLGSDE
ncbi:efflux RND transporter periplasmic adaptor subunit [Emcibacter nanhaiensis]|uniref:Efflux RND transporter periplasmic adaptor subunit n=1 Tax=Emcibacter nanhaiensis TaxID=1505037 RepID=A0A501PKX0_9PROT|nr:efflux RND transporter periplasmic adaptor subunit [Emcibacter nanhaiensis]TPD60742.1 efflux RND transporter periplasmic adaptor subunit [Emcibacter nanhaiensis]